MNNKKSAILFMVEPRSVFDIFWIGDKISEETVRFIDNIRNLRNILGVDEAILASFSPVGSKDEEATIDFDFSDLYNTWCYQSFIEGYKCEDDFHYDEFCKMGPCFYRDGYALLDKSKGFGNYSIKHYVDKRPVIDKVDNYIEKLSKEYDITLFILNDYGYSERMINEVKLKDLGLNIIYFKPTLPHHSMLNSSIYRKENNDIWQIISKKQVLFGINDCFDLYIDDLEKKKSCSLNLTKCQN